MNIHKTMSQALILAVFAIGASAQESPAPVLEDGTRLILAGAGVYENLGERIYVGGIFLPLLDVSIQPGKSKRMEMRVAVETLSARRFSRFWTDGITLNSTREERTALVDQITAFGELLQVNLQRGDHVSFDFMAGADETVVLLNGVALGRIAGAPFHDVLLKAWIGGTPPSAQLKAGLLNELPAEEAALVRAEFESLHYTSARFSEISDRYDVQRQLALEEEARAAEEAARQAEQARLAEQERLERLAREEEEARIAALAAAEAERRLAEEERRRHEAEQVALAEEYRISLIQWLVRHVAYPDYSLQKGHEGRVQLSIETGRGGEVIAHEIKESSGNELLDKATLDMVRKASPLPAMPPRLEGDSFTFAMPVNFSLED